MSKFRKFILSLVVTLIVLALVLCWPVTYKPPTSPKPANSYAEAVTRIAAIEANDGSLDLYPGCSSQFMTHGQKVERAIVFLHGYRNCPKQFHRLGEIFHQMGYNVFIPRMPHMGLADVMATAQAQLKADELAAYVTEAVDIAQGLGDQVTVVGLSGGGVLTGWAAQTRADVDRAVIIAPGFGLQAIPAQLTTPATKLFSILPNFFLWQDDELKADVPNPGQVYPQNATRAVSAILRMSFAVRAAARRSQPAASSILVVTNANDGAVDNQAVSEVVASWRGSGFENLETYEFESQLQLDHDLIDPEHPKQKVDLVYPVLVELITR